MRSLQQGIRHHPEDLTCRAQVEWKSGIQTNLPIPPHSQQIPVIAMYRYLSIGTLQIQFCQQDTPSGLNDLCTSPYSTCDISVWSCNPSPAYPAQKDMARIESSWPRGVRSTVGRGADGALPRHIAPTSDPAPCSACTGKAWLEMP